ncbi:GNAT family N-acetyltransferase [Heyndrickxia camelliae]
MKRYYLIKICFSGFVSDNVQFINIETLETQRRKKLGQRVAYYFLKDCLENVRIPYWD